MIRLVNTTKIVETILKNIPETRSDDDLLWVKVLEKVAADMNIPDYTKTMPFMEFLFTARRLNLPHFKSVSRARRKLQRKYAALRATKETEAARSELEGEYKAYAQSY